MPINRKSPHGYSHQGISIPLRIAEGIEQWITYGRRPDAFLQAVLCNDLRDAFGWGDAEARAALHAIVIYLHNEAPGLCWGSREKALAWRERKQEENRVRPVYPENSIESPEGGLLSNLPHDA